MTVNHLRLIFPFHILALAACTGYVKTGKNAVNNMYTTDSADVAMNKAMDIARKRFGAFDSAFESGKYDNDKFSIKVKYPHSRGSEYIWLVNKVPIDPNRGYKSY